MRAGRRQTQPWDDYFDIRGNAYNNVRNYWIEQGIWRKAWDEPSAEEGEVRANEPDPRFCKPDATSSQPGCNWGHEDGGPEPDAAQEFERDLHRTVYTLRGVKIVNDEVLHPVLFVQEALEGPNYLIPYPTPPNSEASRPYRQFLYQIVKEREWIKDEMDFKIRYRPYNFDLDAMAYETVKHNWTDGGLWNPEWKELPGGTWLHEEPIQEEDKAEYVAPVDDSGEERKRFVWVRGSGKLPSDVIDDWLEVPLAERRDPLTGELRYPEAAQACADDTQGSEPPSAATLGSQVQDQPPERHGEASSEGGGKSKLGKRKSDDLDEQPPKRPRRNPRRSSQEASGPAGTDKESPAPKDVITKRAKGGNVGAVSSPYHRSPGIVEERGQQTSDAAQGGISTSGQTRPAKRGRPRRGDEDDKPGSPKRQKKSGNHGRGKK
ncbi:hypothetical protein CEP54_001064 [Fusarium duplospermum]|uniref:Uncharacterized protein n=1 Tax=Fusarium duplospermum TaxID=1325734 RepID=A0A428R317_9HYPO|nr:hypothetical protein CEP54_001064 [Fusarium duplospermum]